MKSKFNNILALLEKYAGGVQKAPTESKTCKNGSTTETVYADTTKKTKIGSLSAKEYCICIGKVDGIYA